MFVITEFDSTSCVSLERYSNWPLWILLRFSSYVWCRLCSENNFTNILQSAFMPIFLRQKNTKTNWTTEKLHKILLYNKKLLIKCCWNSHLVAERDHLAHHPYRSFFDPDRSSIPLRRKGCPGESSAFFCATQQCLKIKIVSSLVFWQKWIVFA